MTMQELAEKRARILAEAQALNTLRADESRDWTSEEEEKFDKLMDEYDAIGKDIERQQRLTDAAARANQPLDPRQPRITDSVDPAEEREARNEVYRGFLRFGMNGLTPEQRQVMMGLQAGELPPEARAQAVGSGSAGGYMVPEDFYRKLTDAKLALGGPRASRATALTTDTGADLPMPTDDDTSNSGELLSENTQASTQDVTIGSKTLSAYMWSSKIVKVSLQLVQDSAFNIDDWLADRLGKRIGRVENSYFTTGTGSSQPEGIVTGATLGVTAAAAAAFTYDELIDLIHSVDSEYRMDAEWMFNDTVLAAMRKLKDSNNLPLWQPGMSVGTPDKILGHKYIINSNMSDPATTVKSILFGDMSLYHIRDVRGVQLLRLTERYADYLQVGFLAFSRSDAKLLDAGTHPVKYLQQA